MSDKYLEALHQTVPKLAHRLAVALSAECAMRAYIAWEYYEEPSNDLYNALELAWKFASSGDIEDAHQQSYDKLTVLIQPYREDPGTKYHILLSIVSVLELILTPAMLESCVVESLTAVIDTANCIDRDNQKEAEEEEIEFQLLLLKEANTLENSPITRDMFKRLGDIDPRWVSRILAG
ncbi:MAG: hypothetical protein GY787_14920 [Alteromonadales bacterium]|nr:hypothetical protein [Alteromonadales bacterium]